MVRAIQHNLKEPLESPPNLISPKNQFLPKDSEEQEKLQLADHISDIILGQIMMDLKDDLENIVPRP